MAVLIGINKGENFREQVAIKMTELPMGVTLETADPVIKQGTTEVTLMLKAASDAVLGDFNIKLTGHTASSGTDFSKEIKLTVSKREETPKEPMSLAIGRAVGTSISRVACSSSQAVHRSDAPGRKTCPRASGVRTRRGICMEIL